MLVCPAVSRVYALAVSNVKSSVLEINFVSDVFCPAIYLLSLIQCLLDLSANNSNGYTGKEIPIPPFV